MAEALAAINNIGRKELIERLAASEFSFALWRLPKDREEILIVSIRPPRRTDTHISTLDPGFMINKFQDNHPGKPFFIPADLIFRNDAVTIDPRINAKDLDYFQSELKKKKRAQKNIGGALSVPTAFHDPFRKFGGKSYQENPGAATGQSRAFPLQGYSTVGKFPCRPFFQVNGHCPSRGFLQYRVCAGRRVMGRRLP